MQSINLFDKTLADELLSQGFQYIKDVVDNKIIYSFVGTPELINVLNSNYEQSSFFVSKYTKF